MRAPRKRAGAAPWPTPRIWMGSPLPHVEMPHMRYSEGPYTASHEAQKSGVVPA